MLKANATLPRPPGPVKLLEYFEKSINSTSNIARPRTTKQHGDAEIEPRRGIDGTERSRGQDDDEAEDAVNDSHRSAVRRTEQEAAAAGRGLGAGADDREIDRNHRQHARCEVQRETADQNQQQNRQRPAAFKHAALFDSGFGILDEGEEIGTALITAGGPANFKAVEQFHRTL
jgi:hypothetical protein